MMLAPLVLGNSAIEAVIGWVCVLVFSAVSILTVLSLARVITLANERIEKRLYTVCVISIVSAGVAFFTGILNPEEDNASVLEIRNPSSGSFFCTLRDTMYSAHVKVDGFVLKEKRDSLSVRVEIGGWKGEIQNLNYDEKSGFWDGYFCHGTSNSPAKYGESILIIASVFSEGKEIDKITKKVRLQLIKATPEIVYNSPCN